MALQVASGATIPTTPTPACPMATMDRTGLTMVSLSARVRGFKAGMGVHGAGAMAASVITDGADGTTMMDGETMAVGADGRVGTAGGGMAATTITDMPAVGDITE